MPRRTREQAILNPPLIDGEFLIDSEEAARIAGVSQSRLIERTSLNPNTRRRGGSFIPSYKIAGRRWFKKTEVAKAVYADSRTEIDNIANDDMQWL